MKPLTTLRLREAASDLGLHCLQLQLHMAVLKGKTHNQSKLKFNQSDGSSFSTSFQYSYERGDREKIGEEINDNLLSQRYIEFSQFVLYVTVVYLSYLSHQT